jgi:hypothetical protein
MADEADRSEYFIESVIDDNVKEAMIRAANIPIGVKGVCEYCDEMFDRIVNGACGYCRDLYRLE